MKKWPKPELMVQEGREPFEWVAYDQGKEVVLNPFEKMSMVVRNPAVPHDGVGPDPSKDKFLLTLNADEEYSMLRCPASTRWRSRSTSARRSSSRSRAIRAAS